MQVRLQRYRLPFRAPLRTAVGTWTHRSGVLVHVRDGGHVGIGEAAPLPGFSAESLDDAIAALDAWRSGPPDALPDVPSARHAIEQALLSLEAANAGCTLAELLSDCPRPRVPVNALVAHPQEARVAVEAGYRTLKLKVGFGLEDDVRRVASVRSAAGPEVRIRLDANRRWTEPEAREALRRLEPLDIELVEEPVAELGAMARLRGRIPLAADESVRDAADLRRILDAGAADLIVVKPMLVGGLRDALALIDLARAEGLDAIVTTALEAAPGRHAALAVAAARELRACGLDTGRLLAADVDDGFPVERGDALVPLRRTA